MTDTNDIDDTLDVADLWLKGEIGADTATLIRKLAAVVRQLQATNHAWAVRWQQQFHRAEQAEALLAAAGDFIVAIDVHHLKPERDALLKRIDDLAVGPDPTEEGL